VFLKDHSSEAVEELQISCQENLSSILGILILASLPTEETPFVVSAADSTAVTMTGYSHSKPSVVEASQVVTEVVTTVHHCLWRLPRA
jgi:hypothetical protein